MTDYGQDIWNDTWPEDEDDDLFCVIDVYPDGSVDVHGPEDPGDTFDEWELEFQWAYRKGASAEAAARHANQAVYHPEEL